MTSLQASCCRFDTRCSSYTCSSSKNASTITLQSGLQSGESTNQS
jgi:putative component of membrane protein insertase Oxa1/YidC/SpoIIIJ protein YidD